MQSKDLQHRTCATLNSLIIKFAALFYKKRHLCCFRLKPVCHSLHFPPAFNPKPVECLKYWNTLLSITLIKIRQGCIYIVAFIKGYLNSCYTSKIYFFISGIRLS